MLFGGGYGTRYRTYILSAEGKLEQDLSQDPLTPGVIASYSIQGGKIFALGMNSKEEWILGAFDGKKWSLT